MKENINFCNNCGKSGHVFHQCRNPITSVGIIVFTQVKKDKYLNNTVIGEYNIKVDDKLCSMDEGMDNNLINNNKYNIIDLKKNLLVNLNLHNYNYNNKYNKLTKIEKKNLDNDNVSNASNDSNNSHEVIISDNGNVLDECLMYDNLLNVRSVDIEEEEKKENLLMKDKVDVNYFNFNRVENICKNKFNKNSDDNNNEILYLLIRRKDSLGFVDFMRGKYPLHNKNYILNILSEMTTSELERVMNETFDTLWNNLWGEYLQFQYRNEEKNSRDKFNLLKKGINLNNEEVYSLKSLISLILNKSWNEPEWGFPKGRRNYQETDLNGALREFEEETGYNRNCIELLQNVMPYEEIFTGSNLKSYKHKYYLAYLDYEKINLKGDYQKSEVSKMEWKSFKNCMDIIRPYNLEKKIILEKVNNILNSYTLYL